MKLKKSLTILALAASAIVAAQAYAATFFDVYTYYSDATYSVEVGTLTRHCNGKNTISGTATSYRILTERERCCGTWVC